MSMLTSVELEAIERKLVGVQSLASANGGELIAVGNSARQVSVYNHDSLVWARDLRSNDARIRPTERIRGLAFSADGTKLFVACGPNVTAYEVETGVEHWSYNSPRYLCFLVAVPMAIAVLPDGRLAVSQDSGRIVVLDERGQEVRRFSDNCAPRFMHLAHEGPVRSSALGTDGNALYRWNLETGKRALVASFRERIHSFGASLDGSVLALDLLHEAKFLAADGSVTATVKTPAGLPVIDVSPSGTYIAIAEGSSAGVYRPDGVKVVESPANAAPILALRWLTDDMLLIGTRDGHWGRFSLG